MGNQGSSTNAATYIIPGQKNIQPTNSSNATNVDRQQQQQVTPKNRTEQLKQPVQQYK